MQVLDTFRARHVPLAIALAGIVSHVAAVTVAAMRTGGYLPASHPVAVLGADGVSGAPMFNAFAFVVPGLCAAACAWRLRQALGAHAAWTARLGAHMLMLAGLAFAAQGVWTLDLDELDGGRSRGHATAWMLWTVASVAGGVAMALGLAMRRDGMRAVACVIAASGVLAAGSGALPFEGGLAQRAGMLAWAFGVLALATVPSPPQGQRDPT